MTTHRSPDLNAPARRPTPAEYSYSADETPTRPDGVADAGLASIVRTYSDAPTVERHQLVRLVEAWAQLDTEGRVFLEAFTARLVRSIPR